MGRSPFQSLKACCAQRDPFIGERDGVSEIMVEFYVTQVATADCGVGGATLSARHACGGGFKARPLGSVGTTSGRSWPSCHIRRGQRHISQEERFSILLFAPI